MSRLTRLLKRWTLSKRLIVTVLACLGSGGAMVHGTTLSTLVTFNGPNGHQPFAGLTPDGRGNLYGTTYSGGVGGTGTVFRIALNDGNAFTFFPLGGVVAGSRPYGEVAVDAAGNVYGTTEYGDATARSGTVFKLTPGGTLSTIATLSESIGHVPRGGLIADGTGGFLGTAYSGGQYRYYGSVFRVTPAGSLSCVASFNLPEGVHPVTGLTPDGTGGFYGSTDTGGPGDYGTIFHLSSTGSLRTVTSFDGETGVFPKEVTADGRGNFYGVTADGGANNAGTIFKLAADGTRTVVHHFANADGANPSGRLLIDAAGSLYGVTGDGGSQSEGTVFKFVPGPSSGAGPSAAASSLITLATFDYFNGSTPQGDLAVDSVGNLYGTTFSGGSGFSGTIFKLTDIGFVVPEPASLLLAVGAATMIGRRRSRSRQPLRIG